MTVRTFRSSVTDDPRARGVEFGAAHRREVEGTVAAYQVLFDQAAGSPVDLTSWGGLAREQIALVSPALAEEVEGIALGAGVDPLAVAAVNARTEVLAALGGAPAHECSTVVRLVDGAPPVAVQAWDWYAAVSGLWLVWEIPHPSGHTTTTLTEFGIVGKIGASTRGLGVLFNLLHHDGDGRGVGAPVHVLSRAVLDEAPDLNHALLRLAAAPVSASSTLTLVASRDGGSEAVSVELNPGGVGYAVPDDSGLLVHTNHFLSTPASLHDTELVHGPDSVVRLAGLRRRLSSHREATVESVVAALSSHVLAGGATCCHPDPLLPAASQFQTLATVALDLASGSVTAHEGGPCTYPTTTHSPEENPVLTLKRIDNMDILTRDVQRLVDFYHDTLGRPFHLPYEPDEEWAAIDLGNLTLYIFRSDVGEHAPRRTAVNADNAPGYDSFAFEVDDLDEAVRALDGRVEWVDEEIQWKHPSGTWYRYRPFYDPDGNMLYVTEPHPA
jgi:isopenicillin-N N-acyltransferase-like protein